MKKILEIYNILWYNNSVLVFYLTWKFSSEMTDGKIGVFEVKNKKFTVEIRSEWCKACGICSSLCPTKIIGKDEEGKAAIKNSDYCIGCRMCAMHCPDFCIEVKERYSMVLNDSGDKFFMTV